MTDGPSRDRWSINLPAGEGSDAGTVVDPELAQGLRQALAGIAEPPADPAAAATRDAAAALRELIDRFTATTAPPEVLAEVTGRLEQLRAMLEPYDSVRIYEGASEASGLTHDRAHFDWSPLLGLANPLAPPIRVSVEDGRIVGWARFGLAYEGPPGCVHGGYVAAAFDEVLGLTQSLSGRVGMTGTLEVKYRRPTPLHVDLRFEGRVDAVSGRKVLASGRLYAGEDLTAEARGLFVSISPEKFSSLQAQRERRDP